MNRQEKADFVAQVGEMFRSAGVLVVAHYSGLNAKQMTELRDRAHESGTAFKVVKNRLARLALGGEGGEGEGADLFQGPTAVACSEDAVAAPKLLVDFAKEHEALEIVGGILQERLLNAAAVRQLAELPSLDELRGRLVGQLQAPATRIATVVTQPGGGLARLLARKGEALPAREQGEQAA